MLIEQTVEMKWYLEAAWFTQDHLFDVKPNLKTEAEMEVLSL